eukprot:gene7471-biopygen19563
MIVPDKLPSGLHSISALLGVLPPPPPGTKPCDSRRQSNAQSVAAPRSAALRRAARRGTARHSAAQRSAAPRSAALRRAAKRRAAQRSAASAATRTAARCSPPPPSPAGRRAAAGSGGRSVRPDSAGFGKSFPERLQRKSMTAWSPLLVHRGAHAGVMLAYARGGGL